MGLPESAYEDPMKVNVQFEGLNGVASYNFGTNTIVVSRSALTEREIGYHQIDIFASNEEPNGEVLTFTKTFYLWVKAPPGYFDPPEPEPEPIEEELESKVIDPIPRVSSEEELGIKIITNEQLEQS